MIQATSPVTAIAQAAINTQGEHDPDHIPVITQAPLPAIAVVDDVKHYDPQRDLLQVRNVRVAVAGWLGSRGVPSDVKEVQTLLTVLKDIDASALGQMRIKVDEKTAELGEQQRLMAVAVLQHLTTIKNEGQLIDVVAREVPGAPVLPDDIVTRDFVEGEASQGTVTQTFEQFQSANNLKIELADEDAPD